MSAPGEAPPVRAADRVSDVLARDEALVEVFVSHGPQFAKLRNRAMRRIMARLVTVEQAARMAGLGPAVLVRELNAALGIVPEPGAPDEAGREATRAGHASHPAYAAVVEVDVRDDLRAGREPFSRIMAAVRALGVDQVLLLRTTFEPVPLYSVLARRGLAHEARAERSGDWSAWFWRAASADPADSPMPVSSSADAADPAPPALGTLRLDVRGLEPPEPMLRTLAALETLPADHTLVQVNARVPQFLLPILAERGFTWETDESPADHVIVRIRRSA